MSDRCRKCISEIGCLAFASVVVIVFLGSNCAYAQKDNPSLKREDRASIDFLPSVDSMHNFYEPRPLRTGESIVNLGTSFSLLPEPIVEQELPAPILDFEVKYGISPYFSAFGSASTNYFTNVLLTGIEYNRGDEDFSWSVGNSMVFFAGFFDLGGEFDKNTAAALAYVPSVQAGHRFGTVSVSLTLAGAFLIYADTRIGSLEDKDQSLQLHDLFVTLAFEQPLFGKQRVSTGLTLSFSRSPYQIWMLYNVFDQYLMIPEFFLSFRL